MRVQKYILWLSLVLTSYSCATNLYLPEGKYLVKSSPDFHPASELKLRDSSLMRQTLGHLMPTERLSLDPELLESAVKTKANRRMLLPKTYLHLYNLGKTLSIYEYPAERVYKTFFPKGGLVDTLSGFLMNVAGEPPLLLNAEQLKSDAENLRNVYFSKGYFDATVLPVVDSIRSGPDSAKARVHFYIQEGRPAIIDSVAWHCADSAMAALLISNQKSCLLQAGENYDEEKFGAERSRILELLRSNGYYRFGLGQIDFELDTLVSQSGHDWRSLGQGNWLPVKVTIHVAPDAKQLRIRQLTLRIESVYPDTSEMYYVIRPEYLSDEYRKELGMFKREASHLPKMRFIVHADYAGNLNLRFLGRLLSLKEGQIYSVEKERQSVVKLQDLGIFRTVVARHETDDSAGVIDVFIEARLDKKYQAKAGLEGFSQGNRNDQIAQQNFFPGFGGQLTMRDKRIFRAAERFEVTARGNMSFYRPAPGLAIRTLYELGISSNFAVPRIMLPRPLPKVIGGVNPSSYFTAKFETQRRVEFSRNIFGLTWTYSWFHKRNPKKIRSSISPYVINLISSDLSPEFKTAIGNISNAFLQSLIKTDFRSRFSSKFSYRINISDYMSSKDSATSLFQGVFEFGGNTPYLIDRFLHPDTGGVADTRVQNLQYGQFFKFAAEYKRNMPLGKKHDLVFRIYSGLATPWNYTRLVPFDARFYSGGANSMRGWQSNTLGPGTWKWTENSGGVSDLEYLLFPGGDFIFETNLEYRFSLTNLIELAAFTDAGNVWFLPTSNFEFDEGKLKLANLYPGWDAGMGLRLDFSFFIFRIDFAHQIFAPDVKTFVLKQDNSALAQKRYQFNFGINYPF